jgi:hypothetical protein
MAAMLMAGLALALAVLTVPLLGSGKTVQADPALDIGVDVDTTGNTATHVGDINWCRSVGVGQQITVDVFVRNVTNLKAFQAYFGFEPTVVQVLSRNVFQFLGTQSDVLDTSLGLSGDWGYHTGALDKVGGNNNSGVLVRLTLNTIAAGVSKASVAKIDDNGDTIPEDGAWLAEPDGDFIGDVDGDGLFDGPIYNARISVAQPDSDGDGKDDGCDVCPNNYNPGQEDADGDHWGNICDNCPNNYNPDQSDLDGDGIGDVCDPDVDGDGWNDDVDNCPVDYNPGQEDVDHDGIGNVCDNCPGAYNPYQEDLDGDGQGDACDLDDDGDGRNDNVDNCPVDYNPGQEDVDHDGIGNVCDDDNDNDHMPDAYENAHACLNPLVPDHAGNPDGDVLVSYAEMIVGTNPCAANPTLAYDNDADGFNNGSEGYMGTDPQASCPPPPNAWPPDLTGDHVVDVVDAIMFLGRLPSGLGSQGYDPRADMTADTVIDITDALIFLGHFPSTCIS